MSDIGHVDGEYVTGKRGFGCQWDRTEGLVRCDLHNASSWEWEASEPTASETVVLVSYLTVYSTGEAVIEVR